MDRLISQESIVAIGHDQFSCPLGGDTVILDLKAGQYFSLDPVGTMVWTLIQQPRSVQQICEAILDAFEVTPEVCERDLQALLQDLASRKLVEIRDATTA